MKVRHYSISSGKIKDFKIAHISDTHSCYPDQLMACLRYEKPNLIAITGDLVDDHKALTDDIRKLLLDCVSISPTVMSLGNEEYILSEKDFADVRRIGVKVLDDESIDFGEGIHVGGLTSAYFTLCKRYGKGTDLTVQSNTEFLSSFSKLDGFKILLDHHPENYMMLGSKGHPEDVKLSV